MASYNPSTGLLDIEETPFRLFQADDAIITNTITYQGIILDPSLQIVVDDLSGVVDLNEAAITANADEITAIKGSGYTNQTIKQNADDIDSNTTAISNNTTAIATKVAKAGDTMTGLLQTASGIKFNAGVPSNTTQTLYYDAGVFGIGAGLKFGTDNITDLFNRMTTAEGTIISNTNGINTNSSTITTIKGTGWVDETIKGNATAISNNTTSINTNASDITTIKGTGWVDETIKGNADDIATNTTAIATKVSKSGDTMTGDLTLQSTAPRLIIDNTNNTRSGDTYFTMADNGYFQIFSENNELISGRNNAINFLASAGAYFNGNLVFSGDNNDVVISKTGTSSKSLRLQAGDDSSSTITDDFAIELIVREDNPSPGAQPPTYTAMKVNGKSQQIEINRDMTIDDTRGIIFEGSTTPSSITNKLHRRSDGLYWENTNISAAAVNFWDDTILSGLIFPDTTYSGAGVGNNQGFYFANTSASQGYIQANSGSTNGYQIFGRANNTDTTLHEKIQIDYQGVNFQFGGNEKLFIGDSEIESYEPLHLYDGADLYNDGGLQGQIFANSGSTNGFTIRGRANNTDNTMEDKFYFNSTNGGFFIGGSSQLLATSTELFANVKLNIDNTLVFRDGSQINPADIGAILADEPNEYFNIQGLPASGSALEDKIRIGRTTTTFYDETTHQEDITFGVDEKGINFKDGASSKLLTYNTTDNELQFDGATIGGWDFDVGAGESIDFTNNTPPATTTKRLYRETGTNVDNLYFDGQIIPQGTIASDQTYWTFPSVGGSTLSYLASFKPTYNSGFLTRLQGNSGMELRFNSGNANGTGLFQLSAPSASETLYDTKSINWTTGANVNLGPKSHSKYINWSYNDGTRFVDNNQIIAQANGRDVLLVKNISNTDYQDGDVIIQQRTLASRPVYDENVGGLRIFNPYTTATWGIFTNDAYDLNFNVNGSNKSYINDTGSDSQLNFTAFHRSVVEDNIQTNWEKYTGLIVETTGEYNNIFYDKREKNARYTPAVKEALPVVRLTTKLGSKAVFGVLSNKEELAYDNTQRTYNTGGYQGHLYDIDNTDPVEMNKRYDIASVGECAVWIVKTAGWENPDNGDLFMSSDKQAGYGQIQPDGIVKNITIGKLTCGWDNPYLKTRQIGDYTAKLMGCVLYCG